VFERDSEPSPVFAGEASRASEDHGDFMTVGEMTSAMQLARKRMGLAPVAAKVLYIEERSKLEAGRDAWHPSATAHPVRVTIQWPDGRQQVMYFKHADLAPGLGMPMRPPQLAVAARRGRAQGAVPLRCDPGR